MKRFPSLILFVLVAIAAPADAASSRDALLKDLDAFCRCMGLQRKSGIKSQQGDNITILLAADGVTEMYYVTLVDGHPAVFAPDNYKMHYDLPDVKDAKQRHFCIDRVKKLDESQFSFGHFGNPDVVVDSPRGFRVRYDSKPRKKGEPSFSIAGNIYFLMTPKGTICGVWFGE